MLTLRPFSQGIEAGGLCHKVQPLSLSLRIGVSHPCTRTYVRLLGPCFKTGKRRPFCHSQSSRPHAVVTNTHHPILTTPNKVDPGQDTAPTPQAEGEIYLGKHWFPSLPFQQFQVLFNSLFKVLCIFPSRYLYTIGLPPVFSFRWNLPPTLSCNPKQLDSLDIQLQRPGTRESHPLCCPVPRDLAQPTTPLSTDHNSAPERRFPF